MNIRTLIIFLSAGFLTGCAILPWPHTANVTPKVKGLLMDAGDVISDVHVRIASGTEDDPCSGRIAESITDSTGRFLIEPVKEFQLVIRIMAHTFFPWNLCHKSNDQWYLLTTQMNYTLVDTGPLGVQVVSCDLGISGKDKCNVERQSE